uniref:Putative secreted protein n=1 Tax=Ixodes ricinus TaxID=34613 RepID=A0A090X9H6_IXORI
MIGRRRLRAGRSRTALTLLLRGTLPRLTSGCWMRGHPIPSSGGWPRIRSSPCLHGQKCVPSGLAHCNICIRNLSPELVYSLPHTRRLILPWGNDYEDGSRAANEGQRGRLGPSSAGYRSSSFGTPPPRRRWWALGAPSLRPSMCRCSGPSCCFISSPYSASP